MSETATPAPATKAAPRDEPTATAGSDTGNDTSRQICRRRSALRWETALVVVLVAVVDLRGELGVRTRSSARSTLFFGGLNEGEIAIMALPLLLIVMVGEIDLSVAAMLGLSGAR